MQNNFKLKNKKLITLLAISLPIQILLVKILANYPDFIERYYSKGLYVYISKALRFLFGWIPFSVGDLLYATILIYLIKEIIQHRKLIYKKPIKVITKTFAILSIGYFIFHLFWGLNYYRSPIHKTLKLKNNYSTAELIKITENLITQTNQIHLKLAKNDTLKVSLEDSRNILFEKTLEGYRLLGKKYSFLNYAPKSIKKSILSLPLTYSGYSGYLNPFTNEAQVNSLIPKYHFPLVSCHEQAHQIGYAAENETNFIGYLACMSSEDISFNYAGLTFAIRYCLNEVYQRDQNLHQKLIKELNLGIIKNFEESRKFWDRYENPMENVLKKLYDLFLKSNNQKKGIKSYSHVVALIVNYELQKNK